MTNAIVIVIQSYIFLVFDLLLSPQTFIFSIFTNKKEKIQLKKYRWEDYKKLQAGKLEKNHKKQRIN